MTIDLERLPDKVLPRKTARTVRASIQTAKWARASSHCSDDKVVRSLLGAREHVVIFLVMPQVSFALRRKGVFCLVTLNQRRHIWFCPQMGVLERGDVLSQL